MASLPGALATGVVGIVCDETKWLAIVVTALVGAVLFLFVFFQILSAIIC